MFICNKCGDLVEEVPKHNEYEEYWGHDIVIKVDDQCSCGGEYVEAVICPCCGEYMAEDREISDDLIKKFENLETEGTDFYYDSNQICEDCLKNAIKNCEVRCEND